LEGADEESERISVRQTEEYSKRSATPRMPFETRVTTARVGGGSCWNTADRISFGSSMNLGGNCKDIKKQGLRRQDRNQTLRRYVYHSGKPRGNEDGDLSGRRNGGRSESIIMIGRPSKSVKTLQVMTGHDCLVKSLNFKNMRM
jgi:hypothetical protein